jgi:exopolysaccharide biosynthesis polyprenyl glycosylphosphotransferase
VITRRRGRDVRETTRAGDALLRAGDIVALTIAAPVALGLTQLVPGASPPPWDPVTVYGPPLAISLLLWAASAWLYQVYQARARPPWVEISRVTRALGLVAILAPNGFFFVKAQAVSRLAVGVYFVLAWLLLVGIRFSIRAVLRSMGRTGRRVRYYAVIGGGADAAELVQTIRAQEYGMRLAGYVLEDGGPPPVDGGVVLGRVSELASVLEQHVLDELLFAVPRERLPAMQDAILTAEELGVPVRISLEMMKFGRARVSVSEIAGVPMLALHRTPSDTLELAVKRAFDVLASAAVLVLLAPLYALVAVAIRLDSPGPVLFRQRRVGLNGRTFDILKFRSMYQDAETRQEALRVHNEMTGPVFKMARDPRVTRVGRLIRRTSLDEFPQFWNVLRGEMSIVGPRPPIPAEVRQYKRWQRRRLSVRPGITCIWQVSGRNAIDFERWMELDLQYIDGWSLWGDIQICLKTIPALLSARGAS